MYPLIEFDLQRDILMKFYYSNENIILQVYIDIIIRKNVY